MPEQLIRARIRHRSATEAEWELANPILDQAEMGIVYSEDEPPHALYAKFGNGVSPWTDLPYLQLQFPPEISGGSAP